MFKYAPPAEQAAPSLPWPAAPWPPGAAPGCWPAGCPTDPRPGPAQGNCTLGVVRRVILCRYVHARISRPVATVLQRVCTCMDVHASQASSSWYGHNPTLHAARAQVIACHSAALKSCPGCLLLHVCHHILHLVPLSHVFVLQPRHEWATAGVGVSYWAGTGEQLELAAARQWQKARRYLHTDASLEDSPAALHRRPSTKHRCWLPQPT